MKNNVSYPETLTKLCFGPNDNFVFLFRYLNRLFRFRQVFAFVFAYKNIM